ncbi:MULTISPECIES: recombinase family protein [Thermoactinomyces]|uniref:Recombinase family protein n=1 Tax=Thermoactinomyces daqus TaxID=1329516 RepID=A0A7W1XB94_9BACL|nr:MULTISPECIES: recombinase family protein [Thermoactinomyces]MBA4543440.1 recombinase family protein [Thermoactinomyces daqus]MBH8606034.1 recombinase family protein [Thermoactinomyces sp. CICC 10521]
MDRVCMYLRKSRADIEAEARGEGETLAKHKKALLQLAKQKGLNIIRIRQEIASGESLIHRPEMMELLREVESGHYDAVLVMDMDRLGRGNMREQGIILETFQKSGTKIITPRKVYDLQDEFDEEYSEFEAFMARKELKVITRRLQGGRIRSVQDGNYIGTRPPYGYQIKEDQTGRYLIPDPDQAPVVKMIFQWYTSDDPHEKMGSNKIANKLNELGYRSYTGKKWTSASVLAILKNAVYAGRIQWKKKEYKKPSNPLKTKETKTRPQSEWIDVEGKHESLVSMDTFQKAQEILKRKYHPPYQLENGITNPLAGLIRCGKCGASMVYRPYTGQKPHLMCYNKFCDNKSTRFEFVESRLIDSLEDWLSDYKLQWEKSKAPSENNQKIELYQVTIKNLEQELKNLETQKGRLHDFLERGLYDEETYIERSNNIANRMNETRAAIEKVREELETEKERIKAQNQIIPKIENVLDLYRESDDPKIKNTLLKSILDHCEYKKEKWQTGDEFSLRLYPKI